MLDHVIRAAARTPWAILPEKLEEIMAFLELRAAGEKVDPEVVAAYAAENSTRGGPTRIGNVAIIPINGTIAPRMTLMTAMSGGTSVEQIASAFRQALADPEVAAILFNVDSPGGSVFGIDELAAEIRAARGTKPIVALANPMMASAAYYLGSAADEIVVTPSGVVGSIGVLMMHLDHSAANEMRGVRPTIVSAGRYKAEGSPDFPLSEEARAYMQEIVDRYYAAFVNAVAAGRGVSAETVRNDYGEGRVLQAAPAKTVGMVDRIATFDETVGRLSDGRGRAAVLRRRAGQVGAEAPADEPPPDDEAPDDETSADDTPAEDDTLAIVQTSAALPPDVTVAIVDPQQSPPVQSAETNQEVDPMSGENHTANQPAATAGPSTAGQVDVSAQLQALQEQLNAARAEAAEASAERDALRTTVADQGRAIEAATAELAAMRTERLRQQFTDEARGRSDANGTPWIGAIDQHVAILMDLAATHGEDSEQVQAYIQLQRAAAEQVRAGEVYRERGREGSGGAADPSARLTSMAEARAREKGISEADALAEVARENPALYEQYRKSSAVGTKSAGGD